MHPFAMQLIACRSAVFICVNSGVSNVMLSWQGRFTMAGCCRAFIACLLDNCCVIQKDLPESTIFEYPIEVHQGFQRYLRLSQRHRGTGRAVEHPPFHGRRYSGFMLDNDDFRSAAPLAVVGSDMPTIK